MSAQILIIAVVTAALSFALVAVVRRMAIRHKLMDLPNERSSHLIATPRGGGVAIVIGFAFAVSSLWAINAVTGTLWIGLVGCGSAIAVIGYLDDRYHLSSSKRFLVHIAASVSFVALVGGYPSSGLANWGIHGLWFGYAFAVLMLVWGTNLFNFMDGIDGIAGSEAVFVSSSAAALNWVSGGDLGITAVLLSLAGASLGFLFWNWPPARIFMGDAGSGFLGFALTAVLMAASLRARLPIEVLPILGGVFVVDATTTLIRRIAQRDRWLEAHRTHAYQHLARRFGSHRPVTLMVLAVNILWLFPWALATVHLPENGRIYLAAAWIPLVIIAIAAGAGRREA
jgi:Fuc2NAc and GlcNAc transferase